MYPILDMSISTIIDDLFLNNMLISFFKKYNFIDKIITFTSLKIEKRRRKLLMLSFCFLPVVSVHTLRPNFGKDKINEIILDYNVYFDQKYVTIRKCPIRLKSSKIYSLSLTVFCGKNISSGSGTLSSR